MKKFGLRLLVEKVSDVILAPFRVAALWISGIKWLAWVLLLISVAMILLPPESWGFFEDLIGFFGFPILAITVFALFLYKATDATNRVKKIEDAIENATDAGVDMADDLTSKAGSTALKGIKKLGSSLKKK